MVTDAVAADAADQPFAFCTLPVNVYPIADDIPVGVTGLEPLVVSDSPFGVAPYDVIALPPVAFAVTVTVAAPLLYGRFIPTSTAETVGACGTVVAVIELDALDSSPVPAAFVPLTLKVYAVPD